MGERGKKREKRERERETCVRVQRKHGGGESQVAEQMVKRLTSLQLQIKVLSEDPPCKL